MGKIKRQIDIQNVKDIQKDIKIEIENKIDNEKVKKDRNRDKEKQSKRYKQKDMQNSRGKIKNNSSQEVVHTNFIIQVQTFIILLFRVGYKIPFKIILQ